MTGMDYIAALKIAVRAHEGQTDWEGLPYILHPVRVAEHAARIARDFGVPPEQARVVGVLHDVIEDTHITIKGLSNAGLGDVECTALRAVTRPDGYTYDEFIRYISRSGKLAIVVKLADLRDNTDPARSASSPPGLMRRYEKAKGVLLQAAMDLGVRDG